VLPAEYDEISRHTNGLVTAIRKDGKYGAFSLRDNKIVVPTEFDKEFQSVTERDEPQIYFTKGDSFYMYDPTNGELSEIAEEKMPQKAFKHWESKEELRLLHKKWDKEESDAEATTESLNKPFMETAIEGLNQIFQNVAMPLMETEEDANREKQRKLAIAKLQAHCKGTDWAAMDTDILLGMHGQFIQTGKCPVPNAPKPAPVRQPQTDTIGTPNSNSGTIPTPQQKTIQEPQKRSLLDYIPNFKLSKSVYERQQKEIEEQKRRNAERRKQGG